MKVSSLLGMTIAMLTLHAAIPLRADVGSWCPQGKQAFSAGKFEAANLALNSCLSSPPDDPALAAEGYAMRGETYLKDLDYEAALSDFGRAVELDPANASAWRNKAWTHYKTNELHEAVTAIGKALEADSRDTRTHHVNALILTAMGRDLAAMDAYDLAYSFEDKATVKHLQEALKAQGYKAGAIDGVYGARTRDALKKCIADRCAIPL